ncbi:hypothetical protein FQA39_LY11870 [Lamprigera yunnana]|nr:hypothetical protein FQA39_LY11870 [Lamprigera yunnana]
MRRYKYRSKCILRLITLSLVQALMSNMSSTLRGKHLHAQAREMAFNVYQWIKSQNEDQCTKEIKEKVSKATGLSVRTIERIIKKGSTSPETETDKRFKSPEKKKRNCVCTVTALEDYELRDFCNIIDNFHKTENCTITVSALQEKLSNDLGWQGLATSLRTVLKNLGFKWRRTENNRKLFIEKSEIRALRIDYLKKFNFFANSSVLLFLWTKRISTAGTLYQLE